MVKRMNGEFDNIETYILLDWLASDLESKLLRYNYTGDIRTIQATLYATTRGRTLLAVMKSPIDKIAKEFNLDMHAWNPEEKECLANEYSIV